MKGKKKILYIVGALLVACIIFIQIVFPPSIHKWNMLALNNIKKVDSPMFEKTFLEIKDEKIGLFLMGKNPDNPVLLVCGGGPGIPQFLLEKQFPSALTEKFVVCYWDYRGTGLSFRPDQKAETMTSEQYLEDVSALTDYLKDRFNQEKIYILGHSFGSFIALKAVKESPEKYLAYFAMSQIYDQKQSEYLAYEYMKKIYVDKNDKKMQKEFDKYPIQSDDQAYKDYFSSGLRDKAMHSLGVGTTRKMDSVIQGIFLPSLRMTEYTRIERINIWRAKVRSRLFPVTEDAISFQAIQEIDSIEIPIYFFAGVYDYTCAYSLQKQYFQEILAPKKEFYSFEQSAHSPIYEEFDKSMKILTEILEG